MNKLKTFEDVYKLALLVGKEGLYNMLYSKHSSNDDKRLIRAYNTYAYSVSIHIQSFNDGNNEFEVILFLSDSDLPLIAILEGKVRRYGFGEGIYPVVDYFKNNEEGLRKVIKEAETIFKYRKTLA